MSSWLASTGSHLTAPAIRRLVDDGAQQPSLFDRRDRAGIACEVLHPGERPVACRNLLLVAHRARKRQDLLEVMEQDLDRVIAVTTRDTYRRKGKVAIHKPVDRMLGRHKMKKHFVIDLTATAFSDRRDVALEGIYAIRTKLPKDQLEAGETVTSDKRLTRVERAFQSARTAGLKSRRCITGSPTGSASISCSACSHTMSSTTCAPASHRPCSTMTTASTGHPRSRCHAGRRAPGARPQPDARLTTCRPTASGPCWMTCTLAKHRICQTDDDTVAFEMISSPTPIQEKIFALLDLTISPTG